MFYSQLSKISNVFCDDEISTLDNYFSTLSPTGSKYISLSKISTKCKLDPEKMAMAIKILIDENLLKPRYAIRCPQCGLLLKSYDEMDERILDDIYCYKCEENFSISSDNIEVIYELSVRPYFFDDEQQGNIQVKVSSPVAPMKEDTLSYQIDKGIIDAPNYIALKLAKSV